MEQQLTQISLSDIRIWEPEIVLSLTAEQLTAASWRANALSARERIVLVNLMPSAQHPGFVHYEIWNLYAQEAWTSKKPVLPLHVGDFIQSLLTPLGIRASALEWKRSDQSPPDSVPPLHAAQEYVYFLAAGPYIKIGKASGGPSSRIRELQTGCPFDIRLVAFVEGGVKEEFALHRRFSAYRVRGEWFRNEGELSEHVEALSRGEK